MKLTKRIAISGIGSAFGVLCLLAVAYIPTMNIAFSFLAGLFATLGFVADFRCWGWSLLSLFATGTLGILLTGNVVELIPFCVFFGPFAWLKLFADEKIRFRAVRWILKFFWVNLSLVVMYVLIRTFLLNTEEFETFVRQYWWVALLLANLLALPYDYLLKETNATLKKYLGKFLFRS